MTSALRLSSGLALRDVAVARGGRTVLAGVTMTAAPGEAVLVKGPNGAGKTTLLRAIAGLLPVAGGSVAADGRPDAAARRDRIVYCGHADAVKGALSVIETLRFWGKLYRAPAERIGEAITALDLEPLKDTRAAILSAGQKRRLGLGRLVVSGKPIWLLDEPAASIDAASVRRLIDLVARHCGAGGLAMIATHDRLDIPGARAVVVEAGAR